MRWTVPSIAIVIGIVLCASRSEANDLTTKRDSAIGIGARFTSRNGRFAAMLGEEDDRGKNLRIIDTQTGTTYRTAVSLPLLSVDWTQDGRTIIAIEHLGGGSQLALLHFTGRRWSRFEVEPPQGNLGHYDVIYFKAERNVVSVTYKMTKEKPNGDIVAFCECAFDIDPATNTIQHIDKKRVDRGTYIALHLSRS